jgi:hypothetical protein
MVLGPPPKHPAGYALYFVFSAVVATLLCIALIVLAIGSSGG